jgi:hypothetical protein
MSLRKVVVVAALFGLYWFFLRGGCGTRGAVLCPPKALEEGVGVTLSAAEVCRDAGYLCFEQRSFQVQRFNLSQGRLRVYVRLPDLEDKALAKQLQDAAIEGIMAWDNQPFPITITTNMFFFWSADIEAVWTRHPYNPQAGHLNSRAETRGKSLHYVVEEMAISLNPLPGTSGPPPVYSPNFASGGGGPVVFKPNPDAVRATAMHDIMYGKMSRDVSRLWVSERDFATVAALYALPNGAMVE